MTQLETPTPHSAPNPAPSADAGASAPASAAASPEAIAAAVRAVRTHGPLVHCLTNTVVQTVSANALLAIGAAPAMVDHPREAAPFARIAGGVLINTGTVAPHQVESMPLAAAAAHEARVPWVLDPVAVGYLPVRTELAQALLEFHPTAIRGNASEISALAGAGEGGRGVDSTDSVDDALAPALSLARRTGAIVAVSGHRDLIAWSEDGEDHALWLESGHPLMPRVIGTGCALGAAVAAYLAAHAADAAAADTPPEERIGGAALAVLAAHAHTGAAGSRAGQSAQHPGSFAVAWMDALDALSDAEIAAEVRVSTA